MRNKSPMGANLECVDLRDHWVVERDRHDAILQASGEIK